MIASDQELDATLERIRRLQAQVAQTHSSLQPLGASWSEASGRLSQGEVWWADLPEPAGSGPGFRRPVTWARAPGNVLRPAKAAGLQKDSVANASQIIAVDRAFLAERVAKLPPTNFAQVMSGIDVVVGR